MSKKRKIKTFKKSIKSYIALLICTIFFMILVFNDFGLVTYFELKNKHTNLDREINQLFVQQNNLRLEIDRLQTDQDYIEQIAREKFMMVKPGERIYRVKEVKEIEKQ
tara:strand:+ start:289 stop:612 length:324 start_codon:yes stop_codon:yes gene_type:complete